VGMRVLSWKAVNMLQCVAVCCSVLQFVGMCCGVLSGEACHVLQCCVSSVDTR